MAILAVSAAAISMLGHRAYDEELVAQTRANVQKAELVGKDSQQHADAVLMELLAVLNSQNTLVRRNRSGRSGPGYGGRWVLGCVDPAIEGIFY